MRGEILLKVYEIRRLFGRSGCSEAIVLKPSPSPHYKTSPATPHRDPSLVTGEPKKTAKTTVLGKHSSVAMETKPPMQDGGVAVIQLPSPDSLSTASVKEYAPSFSSEPPPAYQKPRSTAVQVARIAGITLVAASAILGTFLLAAAWVNTRYSCQHVVVPMPVSHTQNHEHLPSFDRLVDPLKAEEQKLQEKKVEEVSNELKEEEKKPPTTEEAIKKDEEDSEEDEEEEGSEDQNSEEIPIQIRLPLQLDFDELAGMLMERNMRSRMNCIVEKKRAEEIVDHHPRTLQLPFGLNLTTDPRHERVTGERMAIFCESGHDQMQQQHPRQEIPFEIFPLVPEQRQQQAGPLVVPLPGPIHLPFQFMGPFQQPHPQMSHPEMPHPQMPFPHHMPQPQMHPQQMHPQQMHPQQMHPQQMHPQQMHPQQMHPQQMRQPQMPHPQVHPEMQHPQIHLEVQQQHMNPEAHHQMQQEMQRQHAEMLHRAMVHSQQQQQQREPPRPQAPHHEEAHVQIPVSHPQHTIHIFTPLQQGPPTLQQIQQKQRQEEILRRQLLEQEELENMRPPPPPAPSTQQLPPHHNSEHHHMPQMGPINAHGPFVMELTEIHPEEISSQEAVPMGRAMRGPMPQRLPVHLPSQGNIRGPAVEEEEEHRPHYVQPRSVPSDPFTAELHRRDKRVKKRCACDCSC